MALGKIAFLGSGETSLAGGRIFESLVRDQQGPLRIALMETPAGFELNSAQVVGRVGEFMGTRLQNYKPIIDIVAEGASLLEQYYYLIHLTDWISYFLAKENQADPNELNAIDFVKEELDKTR